MKQEILEIEKNVLKDMENANSLIELENIKVGVLGKKGKLTNILRQMGNLDDNMKKTIGAMANRLRNEVEILYEKNKEKLILAEIERKMNLENIDVTQSIGEVEIGHKHPITQAFDELKEIFIGMGFEIKEGPEIEYTKFNFDMLNTPLDHPARDIQDTLYILEDVILRTQTSPVQARTMLETNPPLKIIVPGRVYRADNADATHSPMFHQLEGLVVGEGITMGDLKGTLEEFAKKVFGESTKIRLRPHFFPFTEPSVEVDVTCFNCQGKGCKMCKGEGYIEILGAGMVHPNVLKSCGIDANKYTGFAFGFGVDRIALIKNKISNMKYLFENDVKFLKQF